LRLAAPLQRVRRPDELRAAVPPWLIARVIVPAAIIVAYFIWDHFITYQCFEPPCLDPDTQSVWSTFLRREQGLLAWDADWYLGIAQGGYASMPIEALRYFPLYPLAGRFLAPLVAGSETAALLILSNAGALLLAVLMYRLCLQEGLSRESARRSTWLVALAPPAFVLVMAYTEPLAMSAAIACFIAFRRQRWFPAAAAGFVSGLIRPTAILLVPAIAVEAARDWRALDLRGFVERAVAVVAPVAGMGVYLGWSQVANGDALLPLQVQQRLNGRGPFQNPLATLVGAAEKAVTEQRLDQALHLAWIAIFIALLVVLFRRWPLAYGVYAGASLFQAISTSNLNSLERYGFGAFPLLMAVASLELDRRRWRALITVSASLMFVYATAAFDSGYVP